MNNNGAVTTAEIQNYLYSRTDAELIRDAGSLLGSQKLRLSLQEAVNALREHLIGFTGIKFGFKF